MTKQQILFEAKRLPANEREELIEDLRQMILPNELSPEQRAELRRRVEEIDRGEVETTDGEQVMRELRERFQHTRRSHEA